MATPASASASEPAPTRRPYTGSCQCGHTFYIAYLTLPPLISPCSNASPTASSTTRIRKCNCSICHKSSFFHVRLMDSPHDFHLLSPITEDGIDVGEGGLRSYVCDGGRIRWWFCGMCGGRCFASWGEGEVRDVEVAGAVRRAWTPRREGWKEGMSGTGYLSINAASLDPGQEGCDLREWTEKEWVVYLDCLEEVGENRAGKPHVGGMY